jgi:MFS family permease
MLTQSGNPAEAITSLSQETCAVKLSKELPQQTPYKSVRSSLRASTFDGIFAAIFINITSGVLLSNFLVDLEASTIIIGVLAAIPMVMNLLQPLGAYLADQTTSRHRYGLWVYAPSRLTWLVLALGALLFSWRYTDPHLLIYLASGVVLVSAILTALGSASWLSWKAALVPRQLRGRYFGFRNSVVSLTTLICVPIVGFGVSVWPNGPVQGYGAMLLLAVVAGVISILFQFFMIDVNPQLQRLSPSDLYYRLLRKRSNRTELEAVSPDTQPIQPDSIKSSIWQDKNFLTFLLYFGFWTFAVNLSAPFFNIYLLDNLDLDVKWVTLYNSLQAGANLLMLMMWGKLSDRTGNRPLLLLMGVLVAITPLLWLGVNTTAISLWLWLPLLHILAGGTWAAIDLCSNNIQMAIAPMQRHSAYFAIAAAVAGGSGALGTVLGGFLAEFVDYGGLLGMFALSGVLRLVALLPLVFVEEHRGQPVIQLVRTLGAGIRPPLKLLPVKTLEVSE